MNEWVTIGLLGKPRGNRGELLAVSLSDIPGRFETLTRVFLFRDEKPAGEFAVERTWFHDGRPILKLVGVDSIDAAGQWSGCELRVPFAERAALEAGSYFQSDLIGNALIDARSGESLGVVTGWQEFGGPGLMEVDGDWLVPFAPSICREIDLPAKRIVVQLPEGLRELNAFPTGT